MARISKKKKTDIPLDIRSSEKNKGRVSVRSLRKGKGTKAALTVSSWSEKFAESEQTFRHLLENSRDVIYKFNLKNGGYEYVSPSSLEILGIKPEVFIKKRRGILTPLLHPEDKSRVAKHVKRLFDLKGRKKKSLYIEYRIKVPSGEYRWLADNHTVVFSKGKPECYIGNITDITFRKNAQEELLESFDLQKGYMNLLTSIQNALPAHIAMLDKNGVIITVNESWRQFADNNEFPLLMSYGIGANYIKVTKESKGECSENVHLIASSIQKVLKGKLKEFQTEYPCHSPTERRWFRLIVTPIDRKKNKGAVVMHINTTERKLAELALSEREEQYRQLFEEDLTGNYVADTYGKLILCNAAFAKLAGFESRAAALRSRTFRIFSSDFSNTGFVSLLKKGERIPVHERAITTRNGKRVTVLENIIGKYDTDGRLMSVQGYLLDITDRKTAEDNMKKSEEQYKLLFYGNPQPMWLFDFKTLKFIDVNESAIEHYGYSRDEFLKMTLLDIRPKQEVKTYMQFRNKLLRSKNRSYSGNAGIWKHRKKNGELIDVEITRTPIMYQGKNAILILANDVTERLRAEENLKKRNSEINLLYQASQEISASLHTREIYDSIYSIIKAHVLCDSMHISSYETGSGMIKCIASWHEDKKLDVSQFPLLPLEPEGHGMQSRVIRSGASLIINDYEEELKKSLNNFHYNKSGILKGKIPKKAARTQSALLVPMKLEGKVIGVIHVMSYKLNAFDTDDLRLLEGLSAQLSAATANALLYQQAQIEIAEKEKAQLALKKQSEEIILLHDAERDLSSSLETEVIYEKLYMYLKKLIRCASMIISSYDESDNMIRCTGAWIENTRHDHNAFPPIPLPERTEGTQGEVIKTGKSLIVNNFDEVIKKYSSKYYFDESGNVIDFDNENERIESDEEVTKSALFVPMKLGRSVIGVITALSFEANAFSEKDLRTLESLSKQVTAATVNALLYRKAQNEIAEKEKAEAALKTRTTELSILYEAQKKLSGSLDIEKVYENSYQTVIGIMPCDSMLISSFDAKTQMISIVSAWADGQKPDAALFKPLPLAPEGFGIQSTAIRSGESKLILNYNEYYAKTVNRYTLSTADPESVKMYASALVVPLKMEEDVIGVIQVLSYKNNAFNENDLRILESLSGSITAATLNASLYQRAQIEIAERINKENEISEIRKNLEEAQRIAHIGSWMYNSEDDRIYNSGEVYRILGLESGSDSFTFEEAMLYVHAEDRERTKTRLLKAIEDKTLYTNEDRIVRPNGEVRYVKIVGEPIIDHTGNIKGVQGTLQDITDFKLINDELLRSLGEKELMLKEIHHRVKNNLQVVSSLLRLQSETITDKAAIGYLKMSEQRVRSMALIHQQLYRTKDLTRIDFRRYLEELCNYLFFAYDVKRADIGLKLSVDEIYFAIDTALPCGLIVNELVTNSLKHAFAVTKKGEITVSLAKEASGKNILTIKDNGSGVAQLDFENTATLGMELVKTLTEQLEGTIEVNTQNGTEVCISFYDQTIKSKTAH